ncbi:hypothetical protein JZU46_00180 [bacterium]|nr:hypothetical protein [bacterium]
MDKNTINKITSELKDRYPDAGIRSIEINESEGKSTFFLDPTKKSLAFLDNPIIPHVYRAKASTITRDVMSRSYADLMQKKDTYDEDPKKLYEKVMRYYYTEPLIGSTINLLSSLASKGYENDIDDPDIKNFFDTWAFDVNFEEILDWIFLDLFRTSNVVTYKYIAAYEPRVSTISPVGSKVKKPKATGNLEAGAAKKIWSKGHLPIGYTVLNPTLVNITGNLLFNKVAVSLTPPPELGELLKKDKAKLTDEEKALIASLPTDLKKAVEGGGEYQLDSRLVGLVTYKKQPYERYARPRTARVFDALEYKKALQQADLSTLDGISNYILKITIGNDEYPVVSQEELEAVAKLFDTPSKSFDVVWNHTLQVEKIVSPEIEAILGQNKYLQVNDDITGGLSFTRALIDGVDSNADPSWAIRGIREDIEYARRQVTKWIYEEYRQIAEAMGFDRIPKVRWDDSILKDDILYKNVISTMVDRRMLSYETALETLGFDYENELGAMQKELPLVEQGVFGIIGSPFQRSAVQDTQNAPKGTPSNGRPKGQTKQKTKVTDPNKLADNKVKPSKASFIDIVKSMTPEEKAFLIEEINNIQ